MVAQFNQIILSYLGGALAFLSPCFIPTAIGFLSFSTGYVFLAHRGQRDIQALQTSLLFGSGLSLLLALGLIDSPVQVFLVDAYQTTAKIAGVVAIIFGLAFLSRDNGAAWARLRLPGAFLVGALFGAVWPHCLGPILGAILNLSTVPWSAARGTLLLVVYALGLFSSFAVAGAALNRLFSWVLTRTSEEQKNTMLTTAGVILTAIGICLVLTTPWLLINRTFISLAHNAPTARLEELLMRFWL